MITTLSGFTPPFGTQNQRRPSNTIRAVNIVVGCATIGGRFQLLNPYNARTHYRNNNRTFRVPLYTLTISGTNNRGNSITRTFPVVRFGIHQDNPTSNPYVCGLAEGQNYNPTWNATYLSGSGGWRLLPHGHWYIHVGAANPESGAVAGTGCIQIVDGRWQEFQNLVQELAGSNSNAEIGQGNHIQVQIVACTRPQLEER